MNNRHHSNTLVYPQIEFNQGQIRKLKSVHQELFNESNPHNEAKEAASYFKQKASEEIETLSGFISQVQSYPFMDQLKPLLNHLKTLRELDYASLITSIGNVEGEILDLKEDTLDPIKQFMNSEQKNIYDRLRAFEGDRKSNFNDVDDVE